MQYRAYGKLGYEVSALGFGCMRLPRVFHGNGPASVDRERAFEMIRYALEQGVNYFDTALTYHHKTSESILGEALAGGRREKAIIATKQPLAAMANRKDIRRNLEDTLQKLRTDYIDVYLIHNVQDSTWGKIKAHNIIGEFKKFRDEGLIKAIGFSFHGSYPVFESMLSYFPWDMCQVQQNILDVEREASEGAIRLAGEKGIALCIMEPLRGGGLATPPPAVQELYDAASVQRPPVEWAFRHLLDYKEVSCILSGMSTMEQLKENIAFFSKPDAVPGCLTPSEKETIARVRHAYEMLESVPCTSCEYCLPCPRGVQIPAIFSRYNEGVIFENFAPPQRHYMFLERAGQDASRCLACGACEAKCPQHIEIIDQLKKAHVALTGWIE